MMFSSYGIFYSVLILTLVLGVSSESFLVFWAVLELNMLSLVPLLSKEFNYLNLEVSMKYFLVQSLASIGLLWSMIIYSMVSSLFMAVFICLKLGIPPFHGWFMNVINSATWNNVFIFFTWQKMLPLYLMGVMVNKEVISWVVLFGILLVLISGFMQIELRTILTISSVNNTSWMLMMLKSKSVLWGLYMLNYMIILIPVIFMSYLWNISTLGQSLSLNKSMVLSILFVMGFMSLGGLPPFLGFLNKLLAMKVLLMMQMSFLLVGLIFSSLVLLYYYLNISYLHWTLGDYDHMSVSSEGLGVYYFICFGLLFMLPFFMYVLYMGVCTSNFDFLSYS